MWLVGLPGLKLGSALVQFVHDLRAVHDLPGGKLRLALGKGLKPASGSGRGAGCAVIQVSKIRGSRIAFQMAKSP